MATLVAFAALTACKKKKDSLPIPYESLTSTTSYFNTFKGADSSTTVSFPQATLRIKMLRELEDNLQAFGTNPLNSVRLRNLYTNTNRPFADTNLSNATSISLFATTAQSFSADKQLAEQNRIFSFIDSAAAAGPYALQPAAAGVPGLLGGSYLVNGGGVEYTQLIKDGLIGAMLFDQIANVCLGPGKMAADNTTPVAGKNYTALAHNWDEAYGYLTANEYYPKANSAGSWQETYLGFYVRQVNGIYGSPSALYMAFLKGRAAIVNKDNGMRDQQIAIIRSNLEKAIATVAVSYLNKAKIAFSEGTRFHSLSEAAGFIYSLRFAHNAKITTVKSDELMNALMNKPNGFWSVQNSEIDGVRDQLALSFNIDRDVVVNP